jgi:hypothetical protein
MGLFTEFIRRLFIEVSPVWKWAQRNWHIVLICLIASFLAIKYWHKRKV